MLIVSLPPVHMEKLLKEMIEHPLVGAIRYNTGVSSAYDPYETLSRIQKYAAPIKKPVWVDLKGKQLRVVEWANLPEGPIVLNHNVRVKLPAKIFFRGDDCCEIKEVVRGNRIYVDPLPKRPVGRGQSVNILSAELEIEGGLLPLDYKYIDAALRLGINRFMLSFVESHEDIAELEEAIAVKLNPKKSEICLKIESQMGLEFVKNSSRALFLFESYRLMAARDDLMIQIGISNMLKALKLISKKDPKAICASRLFMGLESGEVSLADVSDLEYMKSLGYQHFMISDGISREHFAAVMKFWEEYSK